MSNVGVLTVHQELDDFLYCENPTSKEAMEMLKRIEEEIARIPPDQAPRYLEPVIPIPDPPSPPTPTERVVAEIMEYKELIERIARLQEYVMEQIQVISRVGECETIMQEIVDMQRVLADRMDRVSTSLSM